MARKGFRKVSKARESLFECIYVNVFPEGGTVKIGFSVGGKS